MQAIADAKRMGELDQAAGAAADIIVGAAPQVLLQVLIPVLVHAGSARMHPYALHTVLMKQLHNKILSFFILRIANSTLCKHICKQHALQTALLCATQAMRACNVCLFAHTARDRGFAW